MLSRITIMPTPTPETEVNPINLLTPRQVEILALLVQGHSAKQVGDILSIKRSTVRTQIMRARKKTGIQNRMQLIVSFAIWQWIQKVEKSTDVSIS